jgi:CubicO group peptidase (beta-lactamase class C family)
MWTTFTRGLAALALSLATPALAQDWGLGGGIPQFRTGGPEAVMYGQPRGYPRCEGLTYIDDFGCRVGAFSDFGTLFPSRVVRAPPQASPLKRAPRELAVRYNHEGRSRTLDDYLDQWPATGVLIARGDTIYVERYQYARTDKQLLTSFSMTKSLVGLLIGIALDKGQVRSIDDTAATYVPELADTEYGRTPIKALLQMASGVKFDEHYANRKSDIYTLARMTLEQGPGGSLEAVKLFNERRAPPGKRFSYSSAESTVLALVLARATGRKVADYASEQLWQPLGAEADARWNIDSTGMEIGYAYYNATLRDWARLGLMLAHNGNWAGKSIVPANWIAASTTAGPDDPSPTYGYQIWISPLGNKRFTLRGLRGQLVWVDPVTQIVAVHTSLDTNELQIAEMSSMFLAAREQLLKESANR